AVVVELGGEPARQGEKDPNPNGDVQDAVVTLVVLAVHGRLHGDDHFNAGTRLLRPAEAARGESAARSPPARRGLPTFLARGKWLARSGRLSRSRSWR